MPLTVLQVLPALEMGGAEQGAIEVAGELERRGHRALVISGGGALTAQLGAARHYAWPIGKKSPFTLLLARRLRRLLVEEGVDILHARSRLPAWVAWVAWRGLPVTSRPTFITTVHGPYTVNGYSAIMTKGERVIAVSEFIRDYIQDNYPGVGPQKIAVVPRGVDPQRFPAGFVPARDWLEQWRAAHPQLQGKTLVTLPARITRWKGQEDFICVIRALKQAGLNIHGLSAGGVHPRRRRFHRALRRMAATQNLGDDITFLSHRDDLREVLAISDIVLSLAKEPEAFGRTALEALSLGRPVVAYDHGGAREVLRELQPEGLAPLGDVAAVARKVQAFLKTAPVIAPNRTFTLKRMLDKTLALYEQTRTPG